MSKARRWSRRWPRCGPEAWRSIGRTSMAQELAGRHAAGLSAGPHAALAAGFETWNQFGGCDLRGLARPARPCAADQRAAFTSPCGNRSRRRAGRPAAGTWPVVGPDGARRTAMVAAWSKPRNRQGTTPSEFASRPTEDVEQIVELVAPPSSQAPRAGRGLGRLSEGLRGCSWRPASGAAAAMRW